MLHGTDPPSSLGPTSPPRSACESHRFAFVWFALLALGCTGDCDLTHECREGCRTINDLQCTPACIGRECRGEESTCVERTRRVCTNCETADGQSHGPRLSCPIIGAEDVFDQSAGFVPHVVDGDFTGGEWNNAVPLEGLYTNVYLDYRDGRLYLLNDWRANQQGIRPNCRNYFQITVGDEWLDLSVYGDGRVVLERPDGEELDQVDGAYGFHPSVDNPEPHTIYEFSVEVQPGTISVCCFDPITEARCDVLAREPMMVTITSESGTRSRVGCVVSSAVARIEEGGACGSGEGICAGELTCADRICAVRSHVPEALPDGGYDANPF